MSKGRLDIQKLEQTIADAKAEQSIRPWRQIARALLYIGSFLVLGIGLLLGAATGMAFVFGFTNPLNFLVAVGLGFLTYQAYQASLFLRDKSHEMHAEGLIKISKIKKSLQELKESVQLNPELARELWLTSNTDLAEIKNYFENIDNKSTQEVLDKIIGFYESVLTALRFIEMKVRSFTPVASYQAVGGDPKDRLATVQVGTPRDTRAASKSPIELQPVYDLMVGAPQTQTTEPPQSAPKHS